MLESKPAAEGFTAFHRLPRGVWEVGMERQPFPTRTRRRSPGLGAPGCQSAQRMGMALRRRCLSSDKVGVAPTVSSLSHIAR